MYIFNSLNVKINVMKVMNGFVNIGMNGHCAEENEV